MTWPAIPDLDLRTDLRCPVLLAKWPYFALSSGVPKLDFEMRLRGQLHYISVRAHDPSLGIATLADMEVLLWAVSAHAKAMNTHAPRPDDLRVHGGRLLKDLGRDGGGRQHALLGKAVARLANTSFVSSIGNSGPCEWLPKMQGRDADDGLWPLDPSGWLLDQVDQRQIIKLGPAFFTLKGLRRRLYLWACVHAGGRDGHDRFELSFKQAHLRSGSRDALSRFSYELKDIIRKNALPGFILSAELKDGWDYLVIARQPIAADNIDSSPALDYVSSHDDVAPISMPTIDLDAPDDQLPVPFPPAVEEFEPLSAIKPRPPRVIREERPFHLPRRRY